MYARFDSVASSPHILLHAHVREAMELVRVPLSEDGEFLALEQNGQRSRPIGACQVTRSVQRVGTYMLA